jgi:recyclin-1
MINTDSLQFFDLIQMGDKIQQMIQGYYNQDIKMWIDEQDFLSEIVIEKKQFERILDDSVATGMDKSIQVLVDQCEFLLVSGQGLRDFDPQNVDGVYDVVITRACKQVLKCLKDHEVILKKGVEKQTMEVFFQEVSIRLFQ